MSQSVPKVKPTLRSMKYFDDDMGQPERIGKVIGDVFTAVIVLSLMLIIFFHLMLRH